VALVDPQKGVLEPSRYAVAVVTALEHWRGGCAILSDTMIPALTSLLYHTEAIQAQARAHPAAFAAPLGILPAPGGAATDPALEPSLAAAAAAASTAVAGAAGVVSDAVAGAAAALASAHAALAAGEQCYGDLRGFSLWLAGSLGGALGDLLGVIDGAGERST
jgi:hypothetical protein